MFKGKATTNTDELDKLGVKEGDFLVVMTTVKVLSSLISRNQNLKRNKKKNKKPPKPNNSNLNPQNNKKNLKPSPNQNHNQNPPKTNPAKQLLQNLCRWASPETKL